MRKDFQPSASCQMLNKGMQKSCNIYKTQDFFYKIEKNNSVENLKEFAKFNQMYELTTVLTYDLFPATC